LRLSVIIPARNEEGCVAATAEALHAALSAEGIDHEVVVVDDHSTDGTAAAVDALSARIPSLRRVPNRKPPGFGFAVRTGLEACAGDAAAIVMADGSDDPADLVRFFRVLEGTGCDCVFGTRFSGGGRAEGYPPFKLALNRAGNTLLRLLFAIRCDDVTNAFKLYRRRAVDGASPLSSDRFQLTVELPVKAVLRGFRYEVVPNRWTERKAGRSKFRIVQMLPRYGAVILACLGERLRGPLPRPAAPPPVAGGGDEAR
jgi:dolichol-phosphate mannosyltransferase